MRKLLYVAIVMLSLVCNMAIAAEFKPAIGSGFDEINEAAKKAAGLLSFRGELKRLGWVGNADVIDQNPRYPLLNQFQYYMTNEGLQLYDRGAQQFRGMYLFPGQRPSDPIYVFKDSKLVAITHLDSFDKDMNALFEQQKLIDFYGSNVDLARKIHEDFNVWPTTQEVESLNAYGVKGIADLEAVETEYKNYKELYSGPAILGYLADRATAKSKNQTIAQVVQGRKAEEEKAARNRDEEAARERTEGAAFVEKPSFETHPASQPTSIKGSTRTYSCTDNVNRKLLEFIVTDLTILSSKLNLIPPQGSLCEYQITTYEVMGQQVTGYFVWFYVDSDNYFRCKKFDQCLNARFATFKVVNNALATQYTLSNGSNSETTNICYFKNAKGKYEYKNDYCEKVTSSKKSK